MPSASLKAYTIHGLINEWDHPVKNHQSAAAAFESTRRSCVTVLILSQLVCEGKVFAVWGCDLDTETVII